MMLTVRAHGNHENNESIRTCVCHFLTLEPNSGTPILLRQILCQVHGRRSAGKFSAIERKFLVESRVGVGDGIRFFEFTMTFDEGFGDEGTSVFTKLSIWKRECVRVCVRVCVYVCKRECVGIVNHIVRKSQMCHCGPML